MPEERRYVKGDRVGWRNGPSAPLCKGTVVKYGFSHKLQRWMIRVLPDTNKTERDIYASAVTIRGC